jgi:hypothetical protein
VPVWAWLVPGLTLAAPGLSGPGRGWGVAVVATWLVFVLMFAEEPWSLLRLVLPPPIVRQAADGDVRTIRVVSLNCDVGNARAAAEVMPYHPDIVLL